MTLEERVNALLAKKEAEIAKKESAAAENITNISEAWSEIAEYQKSNFKLYAKTTRLMSYTFMLTRIGRYYAEFVIDVKEDKYNLVLSKDMEEFAVFRIDGCEVDTDFNQYDRMFFIEVLKRLPEFNFEDKLFEEMSSFIDNIDSRAKLDKYLSMLKEDISSNE